MSENQYELSPRIRESCREFFRPYQEQYLAAVDAIVSLTEELPIALGAVYGSMVKGVRRGSDIDLLVLLRDDYRQYGTLMSISDRIQDCIEDGRVNDIDIDLQVRSVHSFFGPRTGARI